MWTDWLYVWLGANAAFIFRGLFLMWVNRAPEPDLASRMHESRERIEREIANAQRLIELARHAEYANFSEYKRSLDLMRDWLTPQQRDEYDAHGCFHVSGCHTGKTYRIHAATVSNVHELAEGKPVFSLCFQPDSNASFFAGDVMLAQKLALETNERAALRIANRTPLNPYA